MVCWEFTITIKTELPLPVEVTAPYRFELEFTKMSKRKIHEYLDRLSEILEYMVRFAEELFSDKPLHEIGCVVQYYDFLISSTSLSPWGFYRESPCMVPFIREKLYCMEYCR